MATFFKTPRLFRWLFHRRIWGFSDSKNVFLTFDDGPTDEILPWILDFLEKEHIKATFFCVGENAKNHPELMERIKMNGHSIGNHTMRHEKGTNTTKKDYLNSIDEASKYTSSTLFRPPYGRMPSHFYRPVSEDYSIIMWSWLSYDYNEKIPVSRILKKAKNIKGGDIIVLHDNVKVSERLKEILPQLVDVIRKKGLEFAKIE